MKRKKVVVAAYDPKWKEDFLKIANRLKKALGDTALSIEHVGSTSVEGLAAKPCIDIIVLIRDKSVFFEVVRSLARIGYRHEGDLGIEDREAFAYQGKRRLKRHHLYVCPQSSKECTRELAFRDFLRANPEAMAEYGKVKQEAARLFPRDIQGYIDYKAPCIEKLYRMAGIN